MLTMPRYPLLVANCTCVLVGTCLTRDLVESHRVYDSYVSYLIDNIIPLDEILLLLAAMGCRLQRILTRESRALARTLHNLIER